MLVAGVRPSQIAAIVGNPAERVPAAIMSTARAGKSCLLVPRRAAQRSRDAKMAAGLSRWESERWKATCRGTLHFSSLRLVVPSEILTLDDVRRKVLLHDHGQHRDRRGVHRCGDRPGCGPQLLSAHGRGRVACQRSCRHSRVVLAGGSRDQDDTSQVDIGDVSGDDIMACDSLIIGAPTWHTGADSERSGTVPRGPRVGVLPFAVPWGGLGG